jgi:quercetin dioxygenase-like cupin family protein
MTNGTAAAMLVGGTILGDPPPRDAAAPALRSCAAALEGLSVQAVALSRPFRRPYMTPIERSLAGPVMIFDLAEQLGELRRDEAYRRSRRVGRTLAKSGRLRLTLVALGAGIEVGTHHADSPLTIQLLEGRLTFRAEGQDHELRAGQALFFGPGDAHDIRAIEESALLLTISAIGEDVESEAA